MSFVITLIRVPMALFQAFLCLALCNKLTGCLGFGGCVFNRFPTVSANCKRTPDKTACLKDFSACLDSYFMFRFLVLLLASTFQHLPTFSFTLTELRRSTMITITSAPSSAMTAMYGGSRAVSLRRCVRLTSPTTHLMSKSVS